MCATIYQHSRSLLTSFNHTSPHLRPKSLPPRHLLLHWNLQIIQRSGRCAISPPVREPRACQIQRSNNNNRCNCQPDIQPGTRDIIKPHPPAPIPIPDEFLEYKSYEGPGKIGEWCCGRELAHTAEEDGRAEEAGFGARKGAGDEVDDDGH